MSGSAAAEDVSLGRAVLRWRRQAAAGATPAPAELVATSSCDLPVLTVQRAPVVAELVAPLVARAGTPIGVKVVLENRTGRTETLSLGVGRSADFSLAGLSETQCSVRAPCPPPWPQPVRSALLRQMLPHTTRTLDYVMVPLTCGKLQLPRFSLSSSCSSAEWFASFHRAAFIVVKPRP